MTKCFLTTQTDRCFLSLRRYSGDSECHGPMSYHNAHNFIGESDIVKLPDDCWTHPDLTVDHSDPRWPTKCICGYVFRDTDAWQVFSDRIYEGGGGRWGHRDLPVGAMYQADWMPLNWYWDNQTEAPLHVITPGGTWCIDSRASNCTMPNDRLHRCWVKHLPYETITVNKAGFTCAAGAGSIICGNYHGFLTNGYLTD